MSMMGELTYFLGLQVKQLKHGTFLSQSKYCFDLLKKLKMEEINEVGTPIATNCLMDAYEAGQPVDSTKYRGLIGSLLYLIASRPVIQFDVCLCTKFQANPKESHFKDAKRILKYLKGTTNVGLWYPCDSDITLSGFSDSYYAGRKLDRKSTSGTCHLLGSCLISWNSKKQACVALSTTEVEYIVVGHGCAQIIWLKHQLLDYGVKLSKVPLYCDNTSVINILKPGIMLKREIVKFNLLKLKINWLICLQNHLLEIGLIS